MSDRSTTPAMEISIPPDRPALENYVQWLSSEYGASLEFIIYFGPPIRDDEASQVLVGLREEDDRDLIDPMFEADDVASGRIDVFPHTPSEIARMEAESDVLLLEALADGVPILDRGSWVTLREEFDRRVKEGRIRRSGLYWELSDEPA